MDQLEIRSFSEEEYHRFFRQYVPDPLMGGSPFTYSREQVSRSYLYNHGGYRPDYVHFGAFLNREPVGSLQLKRMNPVRHCCEFGIILQNDRVKNRGIGTEAIRKLMDIARDEYGMNLMIGDTMGRNGRMIRVFEKLGFELTETVPGAFELPDGRREDRLIYHKRLREEEQ